MGYLPRRCRYVKSHGGYRKRDCVESVFLFQPHPSAVEVSPRNWFFPRQGFSLSGHPSSEHNGPFRCRPPGTLLTFHPAASSDRHPLQKRHELEGAPDPFPSLSQSAPPRLRASPSLPLDTESEEAFPALASATPATGQCSQAGLGLCCWPSHQGCYPQGSCLC